VSLANTVGVLAVNFHAFARGATTAITATTTTNHTHAPGGNIVGGVGAAAPATAIGSGPGPRDSWLTRFLATPFAPAVDVDVDTDAGDGGFGGGAGAVPTGMTPPIAAPPAAAVPPPPSPATLPVAPAARSLSIAEL
jgi:hypothetical protein